MALLAFLDTLANVWVWFVGPESGSTTIRNVILALVGILGVPFLVWRTRTADRQATITQNILLNDQYHKAAEMLWDLRIPIRLSGIHQLKRIALDNPVSHHVQVMHDLCYFVRLPFVDPKNLPVEQYPSIPTGFLNDIRTYYGPDLPHLGEEVLSTYVLREDIQEALKAIAFCREANLEVEGMQGFSLNLNGADLWGGTLAFMNLSKPPRLESKIKTLYHRLNTDLDTDMRGAKLHQVSLLGTNISGVDFSRDYGAPATGLTQMALDRANADPSNHPRLYGAIDLVTEKQLEWLGK
jgi:hypothetical protein